MKRRSSLSSSRGRTGLRLKLGMWCRSISLDHDRSQQLAEAVNCGRPGSVAIGVLEIAQG